MTAYLRDPDAITAESFAIIQREASLMHLPEALHPVALRMIHASGMVDLADDIAGDARLMPAVADALATGRSILCDCEMVRSGLIRRLLPGGVEAVVTLNDPRVPKLAIEHGTTRSAAALELWRERLSGAIVLIGNAPTALFRLLDMLEEGAARPSAIIAVPVGFVGAAESKERLVASAVGIPYVTVQGRRGGSAIASAALNACLLAYRA